MGNSAPLPIAKTDTIKVLDQSQKETPDIPKIDLSNGETNGYLSKICAIPPFASSGNPIVCQGWRATRPAPQLSDAALSFSDVVIATPGTNEVRIKIYAAGINPSDVHCILSPPSTASKTKVSMLNPVFPCGIGVDGAGVIESVGWDASLDSKPSSLRVGDRVIFMTDAAKGVAGSFSQYIVVAADLVAKIPDTPSESEFPLIDFPEAAALPTVASAAYVALFDKLRIERSRSIFISGASGGVGTVSVQLAKFYGLHVIASCSTVNVNYVKSLGADHVIDYGEKDVTMEILKLTNGYGVDYLLELGPSSLAEAHSAAVRFGGSLCVLEGIIVPQTSAFFQRQLSVHYISIQSARKNHVVRQQIRHLFDVLLKFYQTGTFKMEVEEVPLKDAKGALDFVQKGHTRSKVVFTLFHKDSEAEEKALRKRRKALMRRAISSGNAS